jgi:hypothetical protein
MRRLASFLVRLAVAGCGSEAERPATVDSTIEQALNGSGPEPRCSKVLSARFLREVYASAAACQKEEAERTDTELHDGLHALFDGYMFDQLKQTASEPGLNDAGAASCVKMQCLRRGLRSVSDRTIDEHFKRDQSAAPPPATLKLAAILESCAA